MQYEVFSLMVQHAGEVVPRAAFLRQIWGHKPELSPHQVDMHIHGVRRRLGAYADRYIETVFRVRYRFRQATQHPRQATSRVCRTSHAKAMRPASSFQPNMNTLRECGLSSPAVR
jgi:DNA-binding winged helix-turn-helix (wHTH) protein